MICIAEIKTFVSDRDDFYTHLYHAPLMCPIVGSDPAERIEVKKEHVHGRTFINANGESVCIGMTKRVQSLLGLPFEVFDNMKNDLDMARITVAQLRDRNAALQKSMAGFKEAGLLKRLKYLFTKNC